MASRGRTTAPSTWRTKSRRQIAWLSRFIQLQPGDVVATGTYHVGLGPVNVGDTLEIEIGGTWPRALLLQGKATGFQPGRQGQQAPISKVV